MQGAPRADVAQKGWISITQHQSMFKMGEAHMKTQNYFHIVLRTQQKQNYCSSSLHLCYVSCMHLCNHVHTSLSCTTQSQHFRVVWPTAQPKTAVTIMRVVY